MLLDCILLVHCATTAFMLGIIWFVQVVHYPLFSLLSHTNFAHFVSEHQSRTGLVVGPAMIAEASTGVLVFLNADKLFPLRSTLLLNLSLLSLVVIWISTFAVQVPSHRKLLGGFDPAEVEKLVRSNWIRTAGWTTRALLLALFFLRV